MLYELSSKMEATRRVGSRGLVPWAVLSLTRLVLPVGFGAFLAFPGPLLSFGCVALERGSRGCRHRGDGGVGELGWSPGRVWLVVVWVRSGLVPFVAPGVLASALGLPILATVVLWTSGLCPWLFLGWLRKDVVHRGRVGQ